MFLPFNILFQLFVWTTSPGAGEHSDQKENKNNDEGIIQFPGEGQIWVDEGKEALKPFTFNVVFEPEATQEDVLEHSGMKR